MKYINWTALVCSVCGICLGALFMGIYQDINITKLETSLYEQTQLTHQWMARFATASKERDLTSDIIHAKMDYEAAGINKSMSEVTDEFLSDTTLTSIDWSYCY